MNYLLRITILLILHSITLAVTNDSDVDRTDSGFGTKIVNTQIYSFVEYHGQRIDIYKSLLNDPKNQIYYYVPIIFPKKKSKTNWIWTSGNGELRINVMFGNEEIDEMVRQKVNKIGETSINSQPVPGVLPFRSRNSNDKTMTLRFQCSSESIAQKVMSQIVEGDYDIEFTFFFSGFMQVSTNMVSINGESLKSVLSKTTADGGSTRAIYIHRTQADRFISNYLANVRKMIYKENPMSDTSSLTNGLEEQFVSLMQQAMANSIQEKIDLNTYGQVWSSSDLNPDRLTSELNKIFNHNQLETEYRNTSDKYFSYNKEYANSLAKSKNLSGGLGIAADVANLSGNLELSSSMQKSKSGASGQTTHDVVSLTDIRKFLNQLSVEIEWNGEKLFPKSFEVYKLTDITDNLQVAVMARELIAEKTNRATIRTLRTLDLPAIFGESTETTIVESSSLPIGTIISYAGIAVPPKWLICNGSSVSQSTYPKLFSIIGTLYGKGDNETTFNLPDFRGRFMLGLDSEKGEKPGLNHSGSAQHILTIDELPAHQHEKGSLHVGADGHHVHGVHDPGHNHGGQTGEGPTRFTGFDWGMQRTKGHLSDRERHSHTIPMGHTGIGIHGAGQHSHNIGGSTASIGNGKPFSIMPPSQTMLFLILSE